MNFGTFEYDLRAKNNYFSRKDKYNNRKINNSKAQMKEEKVEQPIIGPMLPPNWIKETITGNESYDETVKEIRDKLKKTLVTTYFFLFVHMIQF
jgi:hypothetical protein